MPGDTAQTVAPRRPRIQFSLGRLIEFTAVCAVGLSFGSYYQSVGIAAFCSGLSIFGYLAVRATLAGAREDETDAIERLRTR